MCNSSSPSPAAAAATTLRHPPDYAPSDDSLQPSWRTLPDRLVSRWDFIFVHAESPYLGKDRGSASASGKELSKMSTRQTCTQTTGSIDSIFDRTAEQLSLYGHISRLPR